MYKVGDYIVYRRDVCKITGTKTNSITKMDYYLLTPIDDDSLKMEVPVDNRCGYLRDLISKEKVEEIIDKIPTIEAITCPDKMIEYEYKKLMNSGNHEDLVRIIKTTYLRNQKRIDAKKKISDKDHHYFMQAEKYLYNEFGTVLGISYEEAKQYVISKVEGK